MLARTVLEWVDKKQQEAMEEENMGKAMGKCFINGAVEGLVDGAVVIGGFVLAIGYAGMLVGKIKK